MNRMTFITGLALLVVATTLAITITLGPPPLASSTDSEPKRLRSPEHPQVKDSASQGSRVRETAAHQTLDEQRATFRRWERPLGNREPQHFSVGVPENHPERHVLVSKAAKVQSYAEIRLEELDRQLDLTLEQRRRLFPILARSSENYDPAMRISGVTDGSPATVVAAGAPLPAVAAADLALAATAAVEVAIQGELDPTQRDERIENSVNDMALWKEIIDGLQQQLEERTPRVSASEPLMESVIEPAPPGGATSSPARGNLFDLIEPNE